MLTEPAGQSEAKRSNRLILVEGGALLASAPFLLFPAAYPLLTLAGLILLGTIWLLPLFVRQRPNLPATPFNLVLVVWGVWLIVGILVSADPTETLPKATGLVLALATWRFLAIAVTNQKVYRGALAGSLVVAAGFSLVGLAGLDVIIKIPALTLTNPFQQLPNPLFTELAIHPNQLAGLICLYLPLSVSLLFGGRQTGASSWAGVGLVILVLVASSILLFTQSRGGWIATATGLLALAGLWGAVLPPSRTRRILRGAVAFIVLCFLIVVILAGPSRLADFWLNPPAETVVGTLETLNYRRNLWPWAIEAIGDFPFTGTGLGTFRNVVFRLYPLAFSPKSDIGHAHNIFLQTALDVGLPGLIAYLSLLIVAGTIGWRVARRSSTLRPAALGMLAGLIALHVYGLADALALGSKPGIVFWLVLGLLTGMNRIVFGNKPTHQADQPE